MAKKVFNMEGGLHSANAFTAFEARAYGSCVANATSLKVVPAGGMNVRVSIGDGIIDGQTPRRIQIDAPETIALTPASTSYARKDLIVAYIDSGVSATTSVIDNINNILKIVAVNGTPSAVPATPSEGEIQAKIGAGNQYMILAEITVGRSASSIGDSAILDRRKVITAVPAESLTGKISGSQIANQTITSDNINFATLVQYKVINRQDNISLPTGWREQDVPNSHFRASFVRGGVYKITGFTSFLTNGGHQNGEMTVKVSVNGTNVAESVSGNGTIPAMARIATSIYTANATGEFEVKMKIQNNDNRSPVSVYTGYITIERIA